MEMEIDSSSQFKSNIMSFKENMENIKNGVASIFKLFNQSPSAKKTILNDLSHYATVLWIPFMKIFDNDDYLTIIMNSYLEYPQEVKAFIKTLVEGFSFEKNGESSIPKILDIANKLGIQVNYRNPQTNLESVYGLFQEHLRKVKFLLELLKQNQALINDAKFQEAVEQAYKELNEMLLTKLQIVDDTWFDCTYDFINSLTCEAKASFEELLSLPEIKKRLKKNQKLSYSSMKIQPNEDLGLNKVEPQVSSSQINEKIGLNSLSKIHEQRINPRYRTSFIRNEFLDFLDGYRIEYQLFTFPFDRMVEEDIKILIGSYLNLEGGRIYLGVDKSQKVIGIRLDIKQRDLLKMNISGLVAEFYPEVRTMNLISVHYLPIKNEQNEFLDNLWVVKILVKQGDTSTLYSISQETIKAYMRTDGSCVKLDASKTLIHLKRRILTPKNPVGKELFQDPEPEKPKKLIYNTNSSFKVDIKSASPSNFMYKNDIKAEEPNKDQLKVQVSYGISCRGVPPTIQENDLLAVFKNYKLYSKLPVAIMRDNRTNLCYGLAYVNFVDPNEAMHACNNLNEKVWFGKEKVTLHYQGVNKKI